MPKWNPFDYLSRTGQVRVVRKPRRSKPPPLRDEANALHEAAYVQYNPLVERVLAQLRDAAYGEHLPLDRWPDEHRWCIGDWDEAYERKHALVEVTIEFGADDQPRRFLCRVGQRTAYVPLTEEGLAETLIALHRPRAYKLPG